MLPFLSHFSYHRIENEDSRLRQEGLASPASSVLYLRGTEGCNLCPLKYITVHVCSVSRKLGLWRDKYSYTVMKMALGIKYYNITFSRYVVWVQSAISQWDFLPPLVCCSNLRMGGHRSTRGILERHLFIELTYSRNTSNRR